jgi:hypothetical protein
MYKDMYLDKEEFFQTHTLLQKTDYANPAATSVPSIGNPLWLSCGW